jgi:ABC-type transport system substrate-binding protein
METSAQAAGLPMHVFPQFINPNPTVILDARFRKALYHAMDRQELIESQMSGRAIPADGILWDPGSREWPDISSRVVTYPYDPQRTTQLIESIGYARGSDGFFHEPGTNAKLTVELRTLTSFDSAVKAIYPIASYWERVGVSVDSLVVPQQLQNDRQYRAERPGFDLAVSPRDLTRHHSAEVALPENSFRGANRARYVNAEFDALIDRYFTTIPWRERIDVLGQVVHHMTDQVTVMGVYFDIAPVMVANRLQGVKGRPGGTEVWNIHEWDLLR